MLNQPTAAPTTAAVAYFTMDIALESAIPTYSGGLGVLAGDALRAAADLELPAVGVSLVHRAGYVRQALDDAGTQIEHPSTWAPEQRLEPLGPTVHVTVCGRRVALRAWCYPIRAPGGFTVPVYLLDSDLPENSVEDRRLTDRLYGGDRRYRLTQELLLGVGGVRMLRALGHHDVRTFHMNEGHAALLTLALMDEAGAARAEPQADAHPGAGLDVPDAGGPADPAALLAVVRRQCVFTTHTPVAVGHDRFDWSLAREVLGEEAAGRLEASGVAGNGALDMTALALNGSRFANAVSRRHASVARAMFPGHRIHSITNGVHTATWVSAPFAALFDQHLRGWRHDPAALRGAVEIPPGEIRAAHAEAARALRERVLKDTGHRLRDDALTIGFARRSTEYKRADLVLRDPDRLRHIARTAGPLQIVFSGKAHPDDHGGQAMIRRVFDAARALRDDVRVVYLENYEMELAQTICAGADVWLNTPLPPLEASGTSGMKAALNGVPSLSVRDGWWVEGHVEGVTGWAIGDGAPEHDDPERHADALYDRLEQAVVPLFHRDPDGYARVMRSAIALNGSYFTARRMVRQYATLAYDAPDSAVGE